MEGLTAAETWSVLQHAEPPMRANIFGYFDREKQVEIIEKADRAQMGHLIGSLPPDDRVDILKSVDPQIVEAILPFVPAPQRRDIFAIAVIPGPYGRCDDDHGLRCLERREHGSPGPRSARQAG